MRIAVSELGRHRRAGSAVVCRLAAVVVSVACFGAARADEPGGDFRQTAEIGGGLRKLSAPDSSDWALRITRKDQ